MCAKMFFCVYRGCSIKYNEYFEFPRELDMSPYTAARLAKLEGNVQVTFSLCFNLLLHIACGQ